MEHLFTVPNIFINYSQSIPIVNNGNYIPLVFLLLPTKETKIYEQTFNSLIEVCTSKLSIHFQPKICIVDFEQSIHKAVLTVLLNIILRGCRFHLSQSWWIKIQNVGLSIKYKNHSSDIGKWFKWIFGLPLLEPENVGICFAVDFMGIKPMDERIDKFCDYLVDIYILMKMQLFHLIFGHRVTYQAKEQQMPVSCFTRCLGNIFIHSNQIFLFYM